MVHHAGSEGLREARSPRTQAQAIIELQLAAPDRHGAAEDPRRTGRHPEADRRIPGDPRLREKAARRHRQGAEGSQKDFGDERRTQIIEDTGEIRWKIWSRWKTSR
jgi:hypothetical protein